MPFQKPEIEFPGLADVIKRSRQNDLRLDEICSDYELLLGDYRRLEDKAAQSGPSRCLDIEETLAGLLEEVAKTLGVKRRPPWNE